MISKFVHKEYHFQGSDTVRDIVIGMSDGLTVPFALAAGISGATSDPTIVIVAGLAEIAAGSTAMGLGGYLAATSEMEHYQAEEKREEEEIIEKPKAEREEVAVVFRDYGLPEDQVQSIVDTIAADKTRWRDFMMKFELDLEKPDPKRAIISALTIAGSYIVGGMIPLAPYFFVEDVHHALIPSVFMTLVALFVFGYVKAIFTGVARIKSALQTTGVGAVAAAVAYGLAHLINMMSGG